ncbi:SURF1 family protein [Streptomyces sp. NPDC050658]|uniref:SURF1 family protein n=1 Tax=unclassified Streptomyces TaxID=2593676 RepID=UPI00341F19A5
MYKFLLTPRWWGLNVFLLLGLPFCLLMGWWQIERFNERIDTHRAAQREPDRGGQGTRPLDQLLPLTKESVGRLTTVSGRYAEEFVVPDRYLAGRKGYYVLSVLRTDDDRGIVPVVHGWRAGDADAHRTVAVPRGRVTVTGVVQGTEVPGERGAGSGSGLPEGQLGVISGAALVNQLQGEAGHVYDAWISLTVPSGGMEAVPVQLPQDTGLDRKAFQSLGYSLQWFLFVGFAVIMWHRFFRREVEAIRDARLLGGSTG